MLARSGRGSRAAEEEGALDYCIGTTGPKRRGNESNQAGLAMLGKAALPATAPLAVYPPP